MGWRLALLAMALLAPNALAAAALAQAPAALPEVPERVAVDEVVVVRLGDGARPLLVLVPAAGPAGIAALDQAAAAECALRQGPLGCHGGEVRVASPLDPAALDREVVVPVPVPGLDGILSLGILGHLVMFRVTDVTVPGFLSSSTTAAPASASLDSAVSQGMLVAAPGSGHTVTLRVGTRPLADLARMLPSQLAVRSDLPRAPWALIRESWGHAAPAGAAAEAAGSLLPGVVEVPLRHEVANPVAQLAPPALAPAALPGPPQLEPLDVALLPEGAHHGLALAHAPAGGLAGARGDGAPPWAPGSDAAPPPAPAGDAPAPLPGPAPGPGVEAAGAAGPAPRLPGGFLQEPAGRALAGVLVGAGIAWPLWMLYRRVQQGRALENPQRRSILERIVASPGVTPGELRATTGLHYTSCLHHVRVLQDLGFIEVRRLNGQMRLFENHSRYGATEARLLAAGRGSTSRSLLGLVLRQPDITPAEVARTLGIARSSVKHHVDRLTTWGVLEAREEGAHVRLRVAPGAVDALVALLSR